MTLSLANDLLDEENLYGQTWKNPPRIDPLTSKFETADGPAAVEEAIRNLCRTQVGEIPMNEDQGIDTAEMLFEDPKPLVDILPIRYVEAIRRYEKRVSDVRAKGSYNKEAKAVTVEVSYRNRATGSRSSTTLVTPVGEEG